MWGNYSAAQDSSFIKDTQPFPRWHPKGEREEERGRIGDKKGAKIGKGIHQTYVWGLTWLSVIVCVICMRIVRLEL